VAAAPALHYVFERGGVWVAVLNSTGYPQEVIDRAGGGQRSASAAPWEGGQPRRRWLRENGGNRAQEFEDALRRNEKLVKAVYFDGGHNGLFADATQYGESVRLIAAFLRENLAK
jgi:hypothetical protein